MQNIKHIGITAKDGVTIPIITCNIDESGKKGVVIISHGFGEHSEAYVEHAERLWQGGYASVILDQRGHGKPPEGAKNRHGLIPDYQCFIDDIESVTDAAAEMAPDTPIAIFGHSMGGNIVVNSLLRLPPEKVSRYFCAILESPWLGLYEPPNPVMLGLIKLLNRIAPNFRHYRKMKHDDLSGDEEKKLGYSRDPYYHGYISMRMITGIMDGCAFALENASKLPVKTFLAYADNERVVCNNAIHEFATKAGDMVVVEEYVSNHAIHNDLVRESYNEDLIKFLDSNLSARS